MFAILHSLGMFVADLFKSRCRLEAENLFLALFAKGDRHARRDVLTYAGMLGIDLLAGHRQTIEEALAADHQAILDAYVARQRQGQASAIRRSPVFASPELLDDDSTGQG